MAASSPPFARAPRQRRLALALLALGALVAGLLAGRGGDPATPAPVPRELRAAGLEALAYAPSPAGRTHGARRRRAEPRPLREEPRRRDRVRPAHRPLAARSSTAWPPATTSTRRRSRRSSCSSPPGAPTRGRRTTCRGGRPHADPGRDRAATCSALKVDVAASTRLTRRLDRGVRRGRPPACGRGGGRSTSASTRPRRSRRPGATSTSRAAGSAAATTSRSPPTTWASATSRRRWAATATGDVPYAQLFFDSSPLRHAAAWRTLAALGDDSSTYLWRIGAARDVLRLLRDDPGELLRLERLHVQADSGALVLHPPGSSTPTFDDASAARDALGAGTLVAVTRPDLAAHGLRQGGPPVADASLRALRPEALAVLRLIGDGARAIGRTAPLTVTSSLVTRADGLDLRAGPPLPHARAGPGRCSSSSTA